MKTVTHLIGFYAYKRWLNQVNCPVKIISRNAGQRLLSFKSGDDGRLLPEDAEKYSRYRETAKRLGLIR